MPVSGSFGGLLRDSAPSRSSPCRTGTTRAAGSRTGSSAAPAEAPFSSTAADGAEPPGQTALGRNSVPTRIHASTRLAPDAPPSSDTIRSSASPRSSCPAMSAAKSDRTWYGVARSP